MQVRFGDGEWDLPVETVTWRSAAARALGTATIRVPWGHDACSTVYLDEEHAFPVEIDAGAAGSWYGVALAHATDAGGVVLDCRQDGQIGQGRYAGDAVYAVESYGGLTAGAIVRLALSAALSGLAAGVILPGAIVEAPPLIDGYALGGKTLLGILGDLQQRTGCEWRLRREPHGDYLDWLPPLAPLYEPLLVDGGAIVGTTRATDLAARVWEVIGKDDEGRLVRRQANEVLGPAGIAPQRVIDLGMSAEIQRAHMLVEAELAQARQAGVTYRTTLVGTIGSGAYGAGAYGAGAYGGNIDHIAAIREGMTVRLHASYAGLAAGATAPTCRVLGRSVRGAGATVELELQDLRDPAAGMLSQASITPPAVSGRETGLLRAVGVGYEQLRAALALR